VVVFKHKKGTRDTNTSTEDVVEYIYVFLGNPPSVENYDTEGERDKGSRLHHTMILYTMGPPGG
jgi:hypothetical protein